MLIRPSILPSIVLLCFVFPNLANATETLDPMKKLQDRLRAAYEKEAASEGYEARKKQYLAELKKITLPEPPTYPRLSGVSITYTNAEGKIKDNSTPLFTTAPNSVGDNNSNSLQIGTSFEFSRKWSGGISVSSSKSESALSQGTPATVNSSDSESEGLSFSLAYKIGPKLTVGGSHGISDSQGSSSTNTTPSRTGSSESRSAHWGAYLSAIHQFNKRISYGVSPSYSWSKTNSVSQNPTLGRSNGSSSIYSFGLNQSLTYNMQEQSLSITGGYSHQYVSSETGNANSAKRSPNSGTMYISGRVYLEDGFQIYSTYSHGTGDPIYGDRGSLSLGFASTF